MSDKTLEPLDIDFDEKEKVKEEETKIEEVKVDEDPLAAFIPTEDPPEEEEKKEEVKEVPKEEEVKEEEEAPSDAESDEKPTSEPEAAPEDVSRTEKTLEEIRDELKASKVQQPTGKQLTKEEVNAKVLESLATDPFGTINSLFGHFIQNQNILDGITNHVEKQFNTKQEASEALVGDLMSEIPDLKNHTDAIADWYTGLNKDQKAKVNINTREGLEVAYHRVKALNVKKKAKIKLGTTTATKTVSSMAESTGLDADQKAYCAKHGLSEAEYLKWMGGDFS